MRVRLVVVSKKGEYRAEVDARRIEDEAGVIAAAGEAGLDAAAEQGNVGVEFRRIAEPPMGWRCSIYWLTERCTGKSNMPVAAGAPKLAEAMKVRSVGWDGTSEISRARMS